MIKSLGSRVESEHTQHLRDVRRLEAQTASFAEKLENGSAYNMGGMNGGSSGGGGGDLDFEALVRGGNGASGGGMPQAQAANLDPWETGWGEVDDGLVSAVSLGRRARR